MALVREDEPGDKRLVGYVVPAEESVSPSDLRRHLKQTLPEYMVPASFVMLDVLPLTPHGKVDRKALPAPDGERPELDAAYQAPHPGVEQTLAQLWKQVLRIDQVGRQDNFFELGGDSILSIQIVAKANQAGLRVTPRQVFQYQTIAELAAVVGALEQVTAEQGVVTGPLPLTPIQQWFFAQQLEEPHHWNMVWVLEAKQPLDPQKMEQVVAALLEHHDALRLRFCFPTALGGSKSWGRQVSRSHSPLLTCRMWRTPRQRRPIHRRPIASTPPCILPMALSFAWRCFHFGEHHADRVLLVIHHLAVDGIFLADPPRGPADGLRPTV